MQLVVEESLGCVQRACTGASAHGACAVTCFEEVGDGSRLAHKSFAGAGEKAAHRVFMRGGSSGEHGGHERRAGRAANVARQVGQAGDVVAFALFHAHIGERVDGDEQEREPGGLEAAHEDELAIAEPEVQLAHVEHAQREHHEAIGQQLARVDLAGKGADHGHHGHHH